MLKLDLFNVFSRKKWKLFREMNVQFDLFIRKLISRIFFVSLKKFSTKRFDEKNVA